MNSTNDGMIVMDTPDKLAFAHLAALKGALKLEMVGLRRRGRSAYSIAKQTYGLKGDRAKVLTQLQALVEKALADKENGILFQPPKANIQ